MRPYKMLKQQAINGSRRLMFSKQLPEWRLNNLLHRDDDCVAIYWHLGILLNRIKKSGNTSLRLALDSLESRLVGVEPGELSHKLPRYLRNREAVRLRGFHSAVFVRNPFTRALSMFRDKLLPMDRGTDYARFSRLPGFRDCSRKGFTNFLIFLQTATKTGQPIDRHFFRQVDLLVKPIEEFSVVGHLESVEQDLEKLVKLAGVEVNVSQLVNASRNTPHVTNSAKKLGEYYSEESFSLVSEIFQEDFRTFGYEFEIPIEGTK